jgi:RNA polymerase sigma factor (sigma-70 family)
MHRTGRDARVWHARSSAADRRANPVSSSGPTQDLQPRGGLEAVYWAKRSALLRFVRARVSLDSAEDVLQDLWLKIKSVTRPVEDPVGYLYRAADNLAISQHRSTLRARRRDDQWEAARPRVDPGRFDDALAARQQIAEAERLLRQLGFRTLQTFIMFRVHGMPQRAIAKVLNVSLSTIEKDLQRSYRAIAGLKGELYGLDEVTASQGGDNDE